MPSYRLPLCRLLLAAPLSLLVDGAPPAPVPLRPGAWTFTNTPETATLDGRVLRDLPVGAVTSETTCLTPELAARPAEWIARDLLADCALDGRTVAGGRVAIRGHCPSHGEGFAPGTLTIAGRYDATSYDVRFTTLSPDENGTMGFSGRMVGRRTGECPVG